MEDGEEEEHGFVITEVELKEFKQDYYCNPDGKFNLEIQANHLALLADGYLKCYTKTGNWTDLLKAHALYNSVGVRIPEDETWTQKAYDAQEQYWQDWVCTSYENQQMITLILTERLQTIRRSVMCQLRSIDEQLYPIISATESQNHLLQGDRFCTEVSHVSVSCTEQMISFVEEIFEFSVEAMSKPPPCKFSVVAIGSLAKNEATPFSDLEYIFLIEETSAAIVEYFEKLAVTSYFIIGNLRETKLSYMAVEELAGWFDDQQKNGFKIDGLAEGAGNIPTGNGRNSEHFIVTVDELLRRYKSVLDNPVEEEAKRGDLTAMLQYTKDVFSYWSTTGNLLHSFQKEVCQFKKNVARQMANKQMFIADAKKYNFKPSPDLISKGYTVYSKKELYRYPSILLFNISILTGVSESDSWQTLSLLYRNGYLSKSVHDSLAFLLACACYFRLSAYLYHGSHDDRLSVLPTNVVNTSHKSPASRRWHLPQMLFNRHSEYSVTLKDHIAKCSQLEVDDVLRAEISSPTWLVTFQIHHYCNRWSEALKVLYANIDEPRVNDTPEDTVEIMLVAAKESFQELWNSVKGLSYSLFQLQKWDTALNYHRIIRQMVEDTQSQSAVKEKQLILADACEETGLCYIKLEQYHLAEEFFLTCLDIRVQNLEENVERIALAHLNVGTCYMQTGEFDLAEKHDLESMQICYTNASTTVTYDYSGDVVKHERAVSPLVDLRKAPIDERLKHLNNPSVMLARVIWNLSRVYFRQKRYQSSYDYAHKALTILQEMYGAKASHREISSLYFDISCICCKLQRLEEAKIYNKKAVAVIVQLCEDTSKILTTKWEILEQKSGEPNGAEEFYKFIIEVFFHFLGYGVTHPQTAEVLEFYSMLLTQVGLYSLVDEMLNKSLDIYSGLTGERSYLVEIARTTAGLALNFSKQKDYDSAAEYYNRALELSADSTSDVSLLNRAEMLEEMAEMYIELGESDNARKCLAEALPIYQRCCHNTNHPKVPLVMAQLEGCLNDA